MNVYRCYYLGRNVKEIEASTETEAKRKAIKLFQPISATRAKIKSWQITCVIQKGKNSVDEDVNKPIKYAKWN